MLVLERDDVERVFKEAYQLRKAELHGDHTVQKTMTLLSGAKTADLARFVEDLALLLGRAIQLVLTGLTWPQHESHRSRTT